MTWRRFFSVAVLAFTFGVASPDSASADQAAAAAAKKQETAADAKKPEAAETRKPEPTPEKPFADLVKDARAINGLFNLFQTDEKVYLEIRPDQFDTLFMVSLTCESGIGERGFYAAQMCGEMPVVLHKQAKNVQLVARNTRFTAADSAALHRAIGRSFSDSILGSTKVESLPHPERKSVLIDLGALLLTDLPMQAYMLESVFRIPYRFDAKNSYFGAIKGFEKNVEIGTVAHYSAERPPLPPLAAPGAPPPPAPPAPPRNVPDVRSMIFNFRYSISELPSSAGFKPRLADDRVGHFFAVADDFTTDATHTTTRRHITRWHLDKENPSAALSRPTKPIVFWM
jgi:hypothetical protein